MIQIFTTGGTIDKVYFDQKSDYQVGVPNIEEILNGANVYLEHTCELLMQKDSLDMTEADRQFIYEHVAACPHRQVIITHGTDSMIQSALKLLPIPDKVIVFTGSMQPARFKHSDAEFNVACAVTAVQTLAPGVYITMNGCIFDPTCARKNVALNRFETRVNHV